MLWGRSNWDRSVFLSIFGEKKPAWSEKAFGGLRDSGCAFGMLHGSEAFGRAERDSAWVRIVPDEGASWTRGRLFCCAPCWNDAGHLFNRGCLVACQLSDCLLDRCRDPAAVCPH